MLDAEKSLSLDGEWAARMCEVGAGEAEGWERGEFEAELTASVPGHLQRDLVVAGLEPDYNVGENARGFRAREGKDWWLRREFEVGEPSERTELCFEGLDTEADAWLNGTYLGHHANAHVAWTVDVSAAIQTGQNQLVVRLDDGTRQAAEREFDRYASLGEEEICHDEPRMWVRKPQYVWRWDWCPHLMTCGIWRSVELRGYDEVALRDVRMRTRFAADGSATVEADCTVERFGDGAAGTVELELVGPSGSHAAKLGLDPSAGVQQVSVSLEIPEPARWWPAPLGEPSLYDCRVAASTPSASDQRAFRYGLRTIELEKRDLGEEGESFTFVVNGQPIFCKGAGWNPPEHLFGCVEDEKLRNVVELAAAANMNMLRVNGCGTYESDLFYDLCDEHGILVWQDFPFTCAYFPDDDEAFCDAVREEADLAIRRLRNHASLAIWCGSNEIEWLHALAGDPDNEVGITAAPRLYGERFYRKILPDACARLDPDRPYIPSTPWSESGFPNSDETGTRHVWEYEFERPLEDRVNLGDLELDRSKFVAEFGFLAPSELSSLRRFLPEDELEPGSASWKFHDNSAQKGITDAVIERHWGPPDALELPDYLALGQLFQAEALAAAARHWRRRMFLTSGAITWGYVDCWGTSTSWSPIDYYERLRASYFHLTRAFEPLHVSLRRQPDRFQAWVVNDLPTAQEATLELGFVDLVDSRLLSRTEQVTAGAGAAAMVAELDLPYEVRAYPERFVAYARLHVGDDVVSRARETLVGFEFNRLRLPAPSLSVVRNGEVVELKADSYVFQLQISTPQPVAPSDNWFDLLPGETRSIALPQVTGQEIECWAFAAGRESPGRVRVADLRKT